MIGNKAELLDFASAYGYEVSDSIETSRALRKSNLFMMGLSWKGQPADPEQEDIFPREISGEIVSLPQKVKRALYLMTCEVLESGEEINVTGMTSGPKVLTETVNGAVSVTYSEQSLYNEGFNADFMGSLLNEYLETPFSSGRSANMKVDRG